MKINLELFLTFAKIGAMTFGGGMAMLPMLERELVESKQWITQEEILDYFAVSQCTPGVIAVNTATFVGYKKGGISGGIVATLGVIFPSVLIIDIIAALLTNFADFPAVENAFAGIRVAVCVLILNAFIKFVKSAVVDILSAIILVAVALCSIFTDVSPVIFVMLAASVGLIAKNLFPDKKAEVKE